MHFSIGVCPSSLVELMNLAAGSQSRSQSLDVESTWFSLSSATGPHCLDYPAQFQLGSAISMLRELQTLYLVHYELCCSLQHYQDVHPDLTSYDSPSPGNKEIARQAWGNLGLKQ